MFIYVSYALYLCVHNNEFINLLFHSTFGIGIARVSRACVISCFFDVGHTYALRIYCLLITARSLCFSFPSPCRNDTRTVHDPAFYRENQQHWPYVTRRRVGETTTSVFARHIRPTRPCSIRLFFFFSSRRHNWT